MGATAEGSALLPGLEAAVARRVEALAQRRSLPPGTSLLREGEPVRELIIVLSGELELTKREKHRRDREHPIGRIGAGRLCGELELVDQQPAAATVRAVQPSVVAAIPLGALEPELRRALEGYAGRVLATRLRGRAEESLATAMRRSATGSFVINVLVLLTLYAVMLSALPVFSDHLATDVALLSFPLQLVFAFGAWRFVRTSGYPLHEFGIGLRHLLPSLLDAVLFTAPVIVAVTGLKALYLLLHPTVSGPLIMQPDLAAAWADPHVRLWLSIYAVSCLVQELIVRGALQSGLEQFLVGPHRVRDSVLVAALLFAVNHLHLSFAFAVAAFVPGVFWGWLFARHRNLVGPTLSHVVVGAYVFFVMGVPLG